MAYAKGLKARAICDRCGFEYRLLSLRKEWTGLKVCHECWEPKHPQLFPRHAVDNQILREPRPGENTREDINIRLRRGVAATGYVGEFNANTVDDSVQLIGVSSTTALGTVSLLINTNLFPTGLSSTTALGNSTPNIYPALTGLSSTMNTPSAGVSVSDSVLLAGLASATSLGTASVVVVEDTWGSGAWNEGAWGA